MTLCAQCSDRGMCCRYVELPVDTRVDKTTFLLARKLTDDEIRWVNLHPGIAVATKANDPELQALVGMVVSVADPDSWKWLKYMPEKVIRIETKCSALTDEGRCSLYGTAERPEMCERWPDDVEAQAPVGCAYRVA